MKRDLNATRMDTEGYITYVMLPTYSETNMFIACAQRFLKLLLSDRYGALLSEVQLNRSNAQAGICVARTDKEMKRLMTIYPDSIYTVYSSYRIKKLDINQVTQSLILEIEIKFVGGSTTTIVI